MMEAIRGIGNGKMQVEDAAKQTKQLTQGNQYIQYTRVQKWLFAQDITLTLKQMWKSSASAN